MRKLTFIDLFCGCGGFSLDMERAGLPVTRTHQLRVIDYAAPPLLYALDANLILN